MKEIEVFTVEQGLLGKISLLEENLRMKMKILGNLYREFSEKYHSLDVVERKSYQENINETNLEIDQIITKINSDTTSHRVIRMTEDLKKHWEL